LLFRFSFSVNPTLLYEAGLLKHDILLLIEILRQDFSSKVDQHAVTQLIYYWKFS